MPIRSEVAMGTIVTVHVVREGTEEAIDRAFGWFHEIEARCTRFKPDSELMLLTTRVGTAVPVSAILFEAVQFALLVAEQSGGAFDPTVGSAMEKRGFNREHRSGAAICSGVNEASATWRDVQLDPERRTITLLRPLTLDLGAVAKGLAVDAAAQELKPLRDFAIDAGGDLYLAGVNPQGAPWSVGIRHPRHESEIIETVRVSDEAVCTSGDYERGEHILDGRTEKPVRTAAGVTVIAPSAMMADALATAAYALGPVEGLAFLERMDVKGLIVTPELERYETRSLSRAA